MPEKSIKKKTFISTKFALILIFILGIFIGGGVIFLLKSKANFNIPGFLLNDTISNSNKISGANNFNITAEKLSVDSAISSSLLPDSETYVQIWNSLIIEPGYREMDSLFLDSIIKKIYVDSVSDINTKTNADDIFVENEQMVYAKNYSVRSYHSANLNDSINGGGFPEIQKIYVEYWSSPIHFSGYVKIGKSIRLYSVSASEITDFLFFDGLLYFRRNNHWYSLPDYHEEHAFDKVFSTQTLEILNKLNK